MNKDLNEGQRSEMVGKDMRWGEDEFGVRSFIETKEQETIVTAGKSTEVQRSNGCCFARYLKGRSSGSLGPCHPSPAAKLHGLP